MGVIINRRVLELNDKYMQDMHPPFVMVSNLNFNVHSSPFINA